MTIKEIKNKIDNEGSFPHKASIINNVNPYRLSDLEQKDSHMSKFICLLRRFSMFLRQYVWIRKLYLYIRKK